MLTLALIQTRDVISDGGDAAAWPRVALFRRARKSCRRGGVPFDASHHHPPVVMEATRGGGSSPREGRINLGA